VYAIIDLASRLRSAGSLGKGITSNGMTALGQNLLFWRLTENVWSPGKGGLSLLVHHTDDEREDKSDKHTEKVLQLVKKEGRIVIDMKPDWKTIFPE